MTVIPFSSSFITQYQDAFNELLRLGTFGAQKKVIGKDSSEEDKKADRILTLLQALNHSGLSDKDIEALEYCLRFLNESLVTPAADPLVTVGKSYWTMVAGLGIFRMTGEDVVITKTLHMGADTGSFTMTGQDVAFTQVDGSTDYSMAADGGIFAMTGEGVTLTYYDAFITTKIYNETEFIPSAKFKANFSGGLSVLYAIGNGDFDTADINYISSCVVVVTKVTNLGIAQDNGNVRFRVNGVDEPGSGVIGSGQGTQSFVVGQNLGAGNISYSFSGLTSEDVIEATITEG